MQTQPQHILILGGGYSGVMAARRLAYQTKGQAVQITLVNGLDHFVERIRLHQIASDQNLRHLPLKAMLEPKGIQFIQGWAKAIHPDQKTVHLTTPNGDQTLTYDKLVYALGSYVDMKGVEGVAEYAESLSTYSSSLQVRDQLRHLAQIGGRVVVVGGGLTGIESATELAETYPKLHITLITRSHVGEELSQKARAYLRQKLAQMGIQFLENTPIQHLTENQVHYAGGVLGYDLCLWSGAFAVPSLLREAGLTVNPHGQGIVDDHLRSISNTDIYVVGDSADLSQALGMVVGMGCKTATPMGSYAADDLAALVQGKTHRRYTYSYILFCLSLGRKDGLVQFVDGFGHPQERIITGWRGRLVKEIICLSTVWQLKHEGRLNLTQTPRPKGLGKPAKQPTLTESSAAI